MFVHKAKELLAEGKKVRRAGWPENDYACAGKSLAEFELDEEEAAAVGVKKGTPVQVDAEALVYVGESGVLIGYAMTAEDVRCSDWEEVSEKKKK